MANHGERAKCSRGFQEGAFQDNRDSNETLQRCYCGFETLLASLEKSRSRHPPMAGHAWFAFRHWMDISEYGERAVPLRGDPLGLHDPVAAAADSGTRPETGGPNFTTFHDISVLLLEATLSGFLFFWFSSL